MIELIKEYAIEWEKTTLGLLNNQIVCFRTVDYINYRKKIIRIDIYWG